MVTVVSPCQVGSSCHAFTQDFPWPTNPFEHCSHMRNHPQTPGVARKFLSQLKQWETEGFSRSLVLVTKQQSLPSVSGQPMDTCRFSWDLLAATHLISPGFWLNPWQRMSH